jgi:UPF0271 protein
MTAIDLNCDMGESYGAWRLGRDEEVMPLISSANVACGGHAGDPNVMERTVLLAKRYGVSVGAHPSYPDIAGFGRRVLPMPPEEVGRWVLAQIGALYAVAKATGVALRHVKPHGALYNHAAETPALAEAIALAIRAFSVELLLYCPPASQLEQAADAVGLRSIPEGFADRAYEPNGSLVSRSRDGSVLADPVRAAEQALSLAAGRVVAIDGSTIRMPVQTICVHGDNPTVVEILSQVLRTLEGAGYRIERVD